MIPWLDSWTPGAAGEGETFGQYRLVRRLAVGGMAEVFLAAVHGEAGFTKPVVIKRLHPQHSEDRSLVRMLIDEAHITARLSHSNICQVLDLGMVDRSYFIAMEYIPGEDLGSLLGRCIARQLMLPIEAALFIICEVLAGLDYAHRRVSRSDRTPLGIVHRDVSPQNILISYEGEVKIIDFGIAKARSRLAHTEAGVIKGKSSYMSPEQVEGERVDSRSDIFAAGVVLYELLRGEPHALDLPDSEVVRRVREAQFEPLHRFRPGLTRALERIVSKALAVRPDDRYQSAEAFRSDLLRQLQQTDDRFGKPELAEIMRGAFDEERRLSRSRLLFDSAQEPRSIEPPRYCPRPPTLPIAAYPEAQVDPTGPDAQTLVDSLDVERPALEALPSCHLTGAEKVVIYRRSPDIMTSAREEDDQSDLETCAARGSRRRSRGAGRFSRPSTPVPDPELEDPETVTVTVTVTDIAAHLDEPVIAPADRQPTEGFAAARPTTVLRTLLGLLLVLVTCGGLAVGAVWLSL